MATLRTELNVLKAHGKTENLTRPDPGLDVKVEEISEKVLVQEQELIRFDNALRGLAQLTGGDNDTAVATDKEHQSPLIDLSDLEMKVDEMQSLIMTSAKSKRTELFLIFSKTNRQIFSSPKLPRLS